MHLISDRLFGFCCNHPSYIIWETDEYGMWVLFEKYAHYRPETHKRFFWHLTRVNNPFTKLNTCGVCGKVSTPKKVQERPDVRGWNIETKKYWLIPGATDEVDKMSMLCMGCYNKVRPLVEREYVADELKQLTSKLNRERLKCQRLQRQVNCGNTC